MATPILFFRALWKHVGAVVTTSLVLCAGVGWLEHYYGSLSWPIYTGILGGLFVIGCYRAWLDEYRQRQALEDWQQPKLEIVFRPGEAPRLTPFGSGRFVFARKAVAPPQ